MENLRAADEPLVVERGYLDPLDADEQFWSPPSAGFRWETRVSPKGVSLLPEQEKRRLVAGLPVPDLRTAMDDLSGPWLVSEGSAEIHRVPPLGSRGGAQTWEPNLHREFAALKADLTPIRDFANRYGLLGVGATLQRREGTGTEFVHAERFWDWAAAIAMMADHIRAWELARAKDLQQLRRHVVWGNDYWVGWSADGKQVTETIAVDYRHWHQAEFHAPWEATNVDEAMRWGISRPGELQRTGWRPGDVLSPAAAYVTRNVNRRLAIHTRVAVVVGRQGELPIIPRTLLGVLYGRFALEMVGRMRRGRFCAREGCGKPLLGVHGRTRYCNDECRKLAWYQQSDRSPKNKRMNGEA